MIFRQEIFLFCPIWCRIVLSGVVWCGMAQGGGVHALLRGDGGGGEGRGGSRKASKTLRRIMV